MKDKHQRQDRRIETMEKVEHLKQFTDIPITDMESAAYAIYCIGLAVNQSLIELTALSDELTGEELKANEELLTVAKDQLGALEELATLIFAKLEKDGAFKEIEALASKYGALNIIFKCCELDEKNRQKDKEKPTQIRAVISTYLDVAIQELEKELSETNHNADKKRVQRTRKGKKNLGVDHIPLAIDQLSNAIFLKASRKRFYEADYCLDEYKEFKTGKGISVRGKVSTNLDIREDFELTAKDQFWLENLYALAEKGESKISGADLLKLAGIKNPYSAENDAIKEEAARSIHKATKTEIGIDSTNEAKQYLKRRGKEVKSDITLQPLVTGIVHITEYKDDSKDFYVELRPPIGETDPVEALPLLSYAISKGQIAPLDIKLLNPPFQLRGDNRMLMRYLYRRIETDYSKPVIRLDTLFTDLGIEFTDDPKGRKNRSRKIEIIYKIMEFWKSKGLIKSWCFEPKNARTPTSISFKKDEKKAKK